MIPALAAAFIFLSVAMAAAWAVRWINGNSGWIDTIWTFSVGAAAALALTLLPADGARRVLLAGLVALPLIWWLLRAVPPRPRRPRRRRRSALAEPSVGSFV
mgnify:CR=1 FL=1